MIKDYSQTKYANYYRNILKNIIYFRILHLYNYWLSLLITFSGSSTDISLISFFDLLCGLVEPIDGSA